ncbi:hypothetical protein BN1047_03772 [Mycolicibacterium neoaurum]|uniref:Uncharacterized protein n=1 Tax=Mycolicibacterium neoaurum TaxID=1795 RepID=A0AAV2WPU2_MYCNE|nr:hypothetical protein [Mycolicibacterium neoaurum]CDQ45872.1 hypothetical protein BN1047_03772 [Mycolicibacterium neoaurum]
MVLPYLADGIGDRFAVAHGQHDAAGAPLHDLMQHERGEIVEQMGIVDADHGRLTGRGGGHGVDDAADQLQPVTIGVGCPGGKRAQR